MDLGFLLFFLLLILHLLPLFSTQEFNQSSSSYKCPNDFHCGNLGNLKFPFTNISQSNCGLSMMDCYSGPFPKMKFDLFSSKPWFYIKNMSGENFRLHDPILESLLQENSCNSFLYDIYPIPSPISFVIVSNITLFRCNKGLKQKELDYFRGYGKHESCDNFNIYYEKQKSQSSNRSWETTLSFGCAPVLLPIHSWKNVTKNDTDLFRLLTADFVMEWNLSDECYDCRFKGGSCEITEGNKIYCGYADKSVGNSVQRMNKLNIILAIIAAPTGRIVLLVILAFYLKRKFPFSETKNKDLETFIKNCGSLAPKRYHYSDVKKMTNSFNSKLGQGGYGSVYKGKLRDGSLVAVKVLKESKGNGEEFINEIASFSRTSHVNIVSLLGFCAEGKKKALVYEFMPNGSLEKFIYKDRSSINRQLEWKMLYKIAVGIARGLEYLHRGCNTRILHFDIKPHNILLDENFCPKISDFGLAKVCTRKESMISTMAARGTIGFIAPEIVCKNIGGISHKSDVYSYGMMVLEMVGGRKNVDDGVDHTSEIYFPHWVYTRLCEGEELAISGIKDDEEKGQARKMLIVSLWCIQTNPSNRPTISEVLEMLEGPFECLEMPPRPFLYSPSRASFQGSTMS